MKKIFITLSFFLFPLLSLYSQKIGILDYFQYKPENYKPMIGNHYSFVDKDGKVKTIGGVYYDEQLGKYFIFSDDFLNINTYLFVPEGMEVKSLNDLKNIHVGVIKGTFAEKYLFKNFPFLKLTVFLETEDMMKSVSKNEITAFVHNFPNAMFFLSRFEMYRKFKPIRLFEPKEISSGNKNEDQKFVFYSDNELTEIEEKNIQEKNSSFYSIPVLIGLSVFIIWLVLRRKKRKVKILKIPSERWSLLFHQGENDQLEFKASLRWDYKNSQINKILEYTVAKTLCAFLNSSGGMLFIGISDSKDVLGLEEDYQTLGKHHQSRDGFILRLTSIINEYLGKEVHRFISIQVEEIEGKDIALIQLSPSSHPVFLMLKDREEFFIRTAASSQSMGLRESHNYIRMKWG